jgi:diacylglycerol kinase (ATP)
MKKLQANFINSLNGLRFALTEHSFRLELWGGIAIALLLVFVPQSTLFKLIVALAYIALLVVELLNTALEKLSDRLTREQDPQIKIVKDVASAAVFLTLLALIVCVCFYVYGSRIFS